MSVVNQILNSYKKFLYSIDDLGAYIYLDSDINIDDVIIARSKAEIPIGDTTFIIQGNKNETYSDIITTSDTTFLLNKYIMYTSSTNAVSYKRITSYNNTTGQIIIDSAFDDVAIVPIAKTFQIVTQYSIYINGETVDDVGGCNKFNETAIRFYMDIKTKKDAKKENIDSIIDKMKSEIGKYHNLPIYDVTLTTLVSYGKFEDSGRYNLTIDKGDQLIQYLGTTRIHYYVNNFG